MSDDLAFVFRDEREPLVGPNGRPQGIRQFGYDLPMIAERAPMEIPHGVLIAWLLYAENHARHDRGALPCTHAILPIGRPRASRRETRQRAALCC
jgi:hypothetical protein